MFNKRAKNKILQYSNKRFITLYISLFSVTESIFNPFPVELLLVPATIKYPRRFIKFTLIATLSSTIGAIIAYFIGFYFEESIGKIIIDTYNLNEEFITFKKNYSTYSILFILIGAVTPFPFKIVTIASGIMSINIYGFIIACFFGRLLRYFTVTCIVRYTSTPIIRYIRNKRIYYNDKRDVIMIFLIIALASFICLWILT